MNVRINKATSTRLSHRGKYAIRGPARVGAMVTIALLLLNTGCAGLRYCGSDDPWLGVDKQKHFAASALLGAGITAAASSGLDSEDAAAAGIAAAMGAGLVKERRDCKKPGGCFSWKDLVWNFIGASVGASLVAAAAD